MNPIKKIFVATDLSEQGRIAIADAAFFAKEYNAELSILHVVEKLDTRYDFLVEDIHEKLEQDAVLALNKAIETLPEEHRVKLKTIVKVGSPLEKILETQAEERADLLVLGSSSEELEGKLGPVAAKVADLLPIDVFFVRSEIKTPPKKIVVASDFSDSSTDAIERALELARLHGAPKVQVLHAYHTPVASHYYKSPYSEEELQQKTLDSARKHYDEWIKPIDIKGIRVSPVFKEGKPAATLLDYAHSEKVDLLVVGTHGRTSSSALLLGSVAEQVVRSARCNVWAERSAGKELSFIKALSRIMGIDS